MDGDLFNGMGESGKAKKIQLVQFEDLEATKEYKEVHYDSFGI